MFIKTLAESYQIVKIEQINNQKLKNQYKGKQIGNIKLLWHGTKTKENKDNIIQNGFDISKANKGLHGWGLYFAKNSSYSVNYSSPEGETGLMGFFLAEVALGNVH